MQRASSRLAAGLSPPGSAPSVWPRDGANRLLFAAREPTPLRPDAAQDVDRYRLWVARREQERLASPGPDSPLAVALLLVLDRPEPSWLRRCLRSVVRQTHRRWQLALCTLGSPGPGAEEALSEELAGQAGRIRQAPRPANDFVEGLRAALGVSDAPVIGLLGQHDELAHDALAQLVAALGEADGCYGDEDEIDDVGAASNPRLKPDWSPELLLSTPYLGRPWLIRRHTRYSRPVASGPLATRTGNTTSCCGWPRRKARVAGPMWARSSTTDAGRPSRLGPRGPTPSRPPWSGGASPGGSSPDRCPAAGASIGRSARRCRVTAIICFRDGAELLRACVDTVSATTGQVTLDLVLVDNGSTEPETWTLVERLSARPRVHVVEDPRPFNWAALNNAAAARQDADVLLFLNNDIEARRAGWLEALVAQVQRPVVAVAGARLLYPTGHVQHAGAVVGLGGAAGHVLAGLPADRPGYGGMAVLARDCSAVTGAAMAIRRSVFEELGGFDESLGVDLNDIDLCLRAIGRGYRVVYEPAAELVHHESPSRGTSGSVEDIGRFVDRWESLLLAGDPLLNRNLTRTDCSSALRGPDEERWWRQWRSTLEGM